MKKILLSILMVAGISSAVQAQLHDQTTNNSTSGVVSNYFTDKDTVIKCADDFVVPAGFTWDVDEVTVHGFRSAGGANANMDSIQVEIYANAGSAPGAVIYSGTHQLSGGGVPCPVGDTALVISIPTQTLAEGTYWVSAWGYTDYSDTPANSHRWNWTSQLAPGTGGNGRLIDPDDFFGVGATAWSDVTTLGITDPDFAFAIGGTSSGSGASIVEETLELSLFPNPVVDNITINVEGNVEQAIIYSVNGQQFNAYYNPTNNMIDVTDLPAGTYIIEVTTATGVGRTTFVK